ncbi:MAG TPA: hypothetical protein PKJ51_03065 [Methanothrix sp.]|nr:hypothetical protein [Methanothrix sp.]
MISDRKFVFTVRSVSDEDETAPPLRLRRLDGPVEGPDHPVWAVEARCPFCPDRPVLRVVNVIGSSEHVKLLLDCPACGKLVEFRFED